MRLLIGVLLAAHVWLAVHAARLDTLARDVRARAAVDAAALDARGLERHFAAAYADADAAYQDALVLLRSLVDPSLSAVNRRSGAGMALARFAQRATDTLGVTPLVRLFSDNLRAWALEQWHAGVQNVPGRGPLRRLFALLGLAAPRRAPESQPTGRRAAWTYYEMPEKPLWPDWDWDPSKARRAAVRGAPVMLNGWEQAVWGPFAEGVREERTGAVADAIAHYHQSRDTSVSDYVLGGLQRAAGAWWPVPPKRQAPPPAPNPEAHRRRERAVRLLEWAGWGRLGVDYATAQALMPHEAHDALASAFTATRHTAARGAAPAAHPDALWVLAEHSLWGTHGALPDLARARAAYERLVTLGHPGNATARGRLGFLEGSSWVRGLERMAQPPAEDDTARRQARALMHYTFGAQEGDRYSQLALAYRYHAGIGVRRNCTEALAWYDTQARSVYDQYSSGPPGGRDLSYSKLSFADAMCPVMDPSKARTMKKKIYRTPITSLLVQQPRVLCDSEALQDALELYRYYAHRGHRAQQVFLARAYYYGSILGAGERAGALPRDFTQAFHYALAVAWPVWPRDSGQVDRGGPTGGRGRAPDPCDESVSPAQLGDAAQAAVLLGQMYLRGEGVPRDEERAWVWFARAAEAGFDGGTTGLALMSLHGYAGTPPNKTAAIALLNRTEMYPEAMVLRTQLGVWSASGPQAALRMGIGLVVQQGTVETSIEKSLEGEYLLGGLLADGMDPQRPNPGACEEALDLFKSVAERGDWADPIFHRAEAAWDRGDPHTALLGWAIAADAGMKAAQFNLAHVLERDHSLLRRDHRDAPTDPIALAYWTHCAIQQDTNALRRVGDYYFDGRGSEAGGPRTPAPHKALQCYAVGDQVPYGSAVARWNLGWMYEVGIGVPQRDFHLAKRHYDMVLAQEPSFFLPVYISLVTLHLRALWAVVRHRDASAQRLFGSYVTAVLQMFGRRSLAYSEQAEQAHAKDDFAAAFAAHAAVGRQGTLEHGAALLDAGDYALAFEGLLFVAGLALLAVLYFARVRVQQQLQRAERRQREAQAVGR